ncbi:MAG: MFS transporter, partial [Acetobacterales bacterium]
AMIYTIGAIVGAASVGPVWARLGRRRGLAASAFVFLIGTTACALAPDMGVLIVARGFQGFAGGLITGGGMAMVSAFFPEGLRKRILAAYQGTWMVAQLSGPLVGGAFAELGWWRGSFWTMIPIILIFGLLSWARVPDEAEEDTPRKDATRFPFVRIALLASGVFAVALAGPVTDTALRVALVISALVLIWATFRLDRVSSNRLYPSGALSPRSPVGLALMILFFAGMAQTSVNLFIPLLLQVVHGVTPLFISFVTIVVSFGWTVGTFVVSGWSGRRERWAMMAGPLMMWVGLAGIAATATLPWLVVLTLCAFLLGLGVGVHNVHLVARTMANAKPGEERVTSSAMPSVRSIGTAFGAAVAGVLSTIAGLGDATEPEAVGRAVTLVYSANLVPLTGAVIFMALLVRMTARRA